MSNDSFYTPSTLEGGASLQLTSWKTPQSKGKIEIISSFLTPKKCTPCQSTNQKGGNKDEDEDDPIMDISDDENVT